MTDAFETHRRPLFGLAYRLLGSVSDAEDVLQDAWLRTREAVMQHPRAFLSRVVTNLCLDRLRSGAKQREEYPGTWLPEPVAEADDPEATAIQRESLRYAFVRLLQELNPRERAAWLLREVYEHDYAALAQWLEESEENCRQLVSRARKRLQEGRKRFTSDARAVEEMVQAFFGQSDLTGRLVEDVRVWSDGGGKVAAALYPVDGAGNVERFLLGLRKKAGDMLDWRMTTLNGEPAALLYLGGKLDTAAILVMEEGRLVECFFVRNPDKLKNIH